MKERTEVEEHIRAIAETVMWFQGYIGRDGSASNLPSLYGLRRAQTYLEKRAPSADDAGYRELAEMVERPTFESLDRKMDAANADDASPRLRPKLNKPAVPLTKAGTPDKRTVNALKRRAAAAKSAGKKVKGRK